MSIKKIILTEKTKQLENKFKVYTFSVSPNLNKYQIKKELTDLFPKIEIKKVRTCRSKPVLQKMRHTQKLPGTHYTKAVKKAFIQLSVGEFDIAKNTQDSMKKVGLLSGKKT